MNASLVGESAESGDIVVTEWPSVYTVLGFHTKDSTHKGTDISTASATKFSNSLNIGRLYLLLTYSGSATIIRAMRPPSGVMPFLSPIPSCKERGERKSSYRRRLRTTDVSTCVAPASKAA